MKKSLSLILLVCMLLVALASCSSGGNASPNGATTTKAPLDSTYNETKIEEYDSEGNYILTSTDERAVFPTSYGYVVFAFTGNAIRKISIVQEFETEKEALDFVVSYMQENGSSGKNAIPNGKLVIMNATAADEEFKYYASSKSDILAAYGTTVTE